MFSNEYNRTFTVIASGCVGAFSIITTRILCTFIYVWKKEHNHFVSRVYFLSYTRQCSSLACSGCKNVFSSRHKGCYVTACVLNFFILNSPCSFMFFYYPFSVFCLRKLLFFPGFLPVKSNFLLGQNNPKYRDWVKKNKKKTSKQTKTK